MVWVLDVGLVLFGVIVLKDILLLDVDELCDLLVMCNDIVVDLWLVCIYDLIDEVVKVDFDVVVLVFENCKLSWVELVWVLDVLVVWLVELGVGLD